MSLEKEIIIDELDSQVYIIRSYINDETSTKILEQLRKKAHWERRTSHIYGKEMLQPRRTCAVGEKGLFHNYSGVSIELIDWDDKNAEPWVKTVKNVKNKIEKTEKMKINSSLLNEYEDGESYIPYHSDKELKTKFVATVSLGGSRDFYFKRKIPEDNKENTIKTVLNHGDLVVMIGDTQKHFTHSIPKRAHADYRISLTFRVI